MKHLALTLIALLVLAGCSMPDLSLPGGSFEGKETGRIIITVIDGETDLPLEGVRVKAQTNYITSSVASGGYTDAAGRIELPYRLQEHDTERMIPGATPDQITIQADAKGYKRGMISLLWNHLLPKEKSRKRMVYRKLELSHPEPSEGEIYE